MDRDTIIVSADFEEGCVGVCPDEFFTFSVLIISILYEFINCFVWPNPVLLFCFCFVFCGLCFVWPDVTFVMQLILHSSLMAGSV